ncbi:MAG: Eco57I restriction-modification methylase domain-containing protein [Candidatus Binatia bacterium]
MKVPASCKVYTPADLAEAIVRALGDEPQVSWLEPSHGTGVFVEAISRLGVPKERVVAVDLDPATSVADSLATTFRGVDFLRWASETEQRFDRIVGNPPFISIKRLPPSLQKSAGSVPDINGRPIGRGSNVWYSFVLASLRLLKQGGCLAFVLPSAAEFANYSVAIRRAVRETFSSLELYRCERPLFENVQEGTLVAVARGYNAPPCKVSRKHFETREGLIQGLSQSGSRNGHKCPSGTVRSAISMVTLDAVAEVRLGGVTGDVSYFLMTEERRKALELPTAALTPVVSKARHLQSAYLDRKDWNKLKSSGERIWLFSPSMQVAKRPKVRDYLDLDAIEGGCTREAYKVSIREPWYRTPMPKNADAFLSGMSQHGPWLCINEMRRLNATNTLYVVTFRNRNQKIWYMWALALLSSVAQRQIRRLGRQYADGLIKYEPGPLSKIKLPELKRDVDYRSLYIRAVDALLDGDRAMAKDIADSALLSSSA